MILPSANAIVIRLCDQFLFESGQADRQARLQADRGATSRRYSTNEPGKIKVVGHTDNDSDRDTVRFPSN